MGSDDEDDGFIFDEAYYIAQEKKELEEDIGAPFDYGEEIEKEEKKTTVETKSRTKKNGKHHENVTIEKKTTTVETITTISKSTKDTDNDKKERIIAEGQKDLEGNDVSNINFGELVSRNVMRATHKILENYLVLFPRYGFKNEISGIILYGPNGTGKTEFCNSIIIRQDFAKYCDFEKVDIYDLIDSKMGKTSEKVADKFKEWINIYKKKNRIQVKIIDEGELVFLQKSDKGSKAYSELSNSMLKHTGKFNGIFIILITNDLEYLNKGAISRFEKIYWPRLNKFERTDFMKYKLEKSEIKVDMKDFDKITPYLTYLHFGDIRTHNKLMSYVKGWYVRNHKQGDIMSIEELIPIFIEFNNEMSKENKIEEENERSKYLSYKSKGEVISPLEDNFVYPRVEEMIDYCIKNCHPRFKDNYIRLKNDYEMLGLRGNQLDGFLKPSYKKINEKKTEYVD